MGDKINKQSILQCAKEQLAMEYGCDSAVFDSKENTFILVEDDHFLKIATFGMGAVIMADKRIYPWCLEHLSGKESKDILDGSILFNIEQKLREYDKQLAGLHARYLFWPNRLKLENETGCKIKWYVSEEIPSLYHDKRFENALSYKENKDVLAVAAFDDNKIVSLAAADNYKRNYGRSV